MFYFVTGLLFLLNFNPILSQRRIINGLPAENARYMAYFVRSPKSTKTYAAWLCGGCIVHPRFILTSATCLLDVNFVYAIAGYKKYVRAEKIEEDECTKRVKKKVISLCYSKGYDMRINTDDWWNWRNLGLAKVESPYDFYDQVYSKYCSYQPTSIDVNYNKEFERPGRDVITLGWGSMQFYRPVGSEVDMNEPYLLYGSSSIITKDECRPNYQPTSGKFNTHINRHWICIMKLYGRLDVEGNVVKSFGDPIDFCNQTRRNPENATECRDTNGFRRFNYNDSDSNEPLYTLPTRRGGICQNDHGGPLVTWIGGRPYVIGVATAFLVDKYMRCRGPYAFCSTHCNSHLVHCILRSQRSWWWKGQRRSSYCGSDEQPYIEKSMNWTG